MEVVGGFIGLGAMAVGGLGFLALPGASADPVVCIELHANVAGTMVFTGESPDVVCHEMGHAVLDAIRPQL